MNNNNSDINIETIEYVNNPEKYLEKNKNDVNKLMKILDYANDKYYNSDNPVMSDKLFDKLYDFIKNNYPQKIINKVGVATAINKIKLPYNMGSMNKIMYENKKDFEKWKKNNKSEKYLISDKLDGVSGLLCINDKNIKLYTRGDGIEGSDISHLVENIGNLKDIKKKKLKNITVRGELIMSKEKFIKYEKQYKNARNMVSGIVNTLAMDKSVLKDINFVVYELIKPWLKTGKQYEELEKYGFEVVTNSIIEHENLELDNLKSLLKDRMINSKYEIDGIIIMVDETIDRSKSGNPDYAFAFKDNELIETAVTNVTHVVWQISKGGFYKPVVWIEPVTLSGATITKATGSNAANIMKNKIGPGAIVEIVRSGGVIPKIINVIKQADKPQFPDANWKWNETKVDIIIDDNQNDIKEYIAKNMVHFCEAMKIKNVNTGNVNKLIENDIDSVIKLSNASLNELKEIFGDVMGVKIFNNIHNAFKEATFSQFIYASNILGHGIGKSKIDLIFTKYPNFIDIYINRKSDKDIFNLLINIEGFGEIIVNKILSSMSNLLDFIEKFPAFNQNDEETNYDEEIKDDDEIENNEETKKDMEKLNIVFTGFRNAKLKEKIKSRGGTVNDTVMKLTNLIVMDDENIDENGNIKNITTKIKKAQDNKIKIISLSKFIVLYNL